MKVVQAVRRIAAGDTEPLVLGDISVRKEWGFAGDIARGILHFVRQDQVMEACIGTGKAHSIREWVATCFELVGLSWSDHTQADHEAASGYSCLVSDPSLINRFGWMHETGIGELARLMLQDRL